LFGGHGAYVNSLAHIPGGEKLGFLASGGISTMILIHNVDTLSPEAEHCLIGHTSNVCALRYSSAKQQLISGSWDRTARVWTNASSEWKYQLTLDDHDQAVWDVLVLEQGLHEGSFLTGETPLC
jgi:phospholipase A-2-activating protein